MKTINGAPQFENSEIHIQEKGSDVVRIFPVEGLNFKLNEWADNRRCVNCAAYIEGESILSKKCELLGINFMVGSVRLDVNRFSCAAFESKY